MSHSPLRTPKQPTDLDASHLATSDLVASDLAAFKAAPVNSPSATVPARIPFAQHQAGMSSKDIQAAIMAAIIAASGIGLYAWKKSNDNTNEAAPPHVLTQAPAVQATVTTTGLPVYPPQLNLVTDSMGSISGCQGIMGTPTLQRNINTRVDNIFTERKVQCQLWVDPAYSDQLIDLNTLDLVLEALRGRKDTMLSFNNDSMIGGMPVTKPGRVVVVSGPASEMPGLMTNLSNILGKDYDIMIMGPIQDQNAEIARSIEAATKILDTIPAGQARPADIARVLNLQIINFDFDKDIIPNLNKPVLDRAAELIKQTPNVSVQIDGYTDSVGKLEYNMDLSSRRALAVRNYFASKGVPDTKMVAVGKGPSNPVADNVTDQGRFRNRRIEFWVTNTVTGSTIAVDPDTVPGQETVKVQDSNTLTVESNAR